MRYLRQFGIILVLSFLGELLNGLIPLPIPASIYGLALMFLCLRLGVIRLSAVRETARFLIEIMPVMFIPAAVGLMTCWDIIRPRLGAYLLIIGVTTLAVMLAAGRVTQGLLRRGKGDAGV